jgi:hypothetical protein
MDLPARYGSGSPGSPGSAEGKTQNLCMGASVDPNDPDRLVYTYRVTAGVNKYSSVKEILQERGLLSPLPNPSDDRGLVPRKTTEGGSKE